MSDDDSPTAPDLSDFSEYQHEGGPYDHSRARGFLTETERKFLVGELDYEGQQARNTRYRIRQHTIDGLLDAALIARHLRPAEYRTIIEKDRFRAAQISQKLVNLAYSFVLFEAEPNSEAPVETFEEIIENALFKAHPYEEGVTTKRSVSVDIKLDDFDLEDTEERVKTGDATPNEMLFYYDLSQEGLENDTPGEDPLSDFEFDEEVVEKIESQLSEIEALADFTMK